MFQTQPRGSMVFWRGGEVLCGALRLHHESRKLRGLPRVAAGRAGTLSNQLTTYQSPGASYPVTLAPSVPLGRDDSSEEMSHTLERLSNPPEVPVRVLTQKEGDCVCLPAPNVSTRGCVRAAGSRCASPRRARPARCAAAFSPSSLFTPPHCLRLSMCSHINSADGGWDPR